MIQIGFLSRNRAVNGLAKSNSASCIGRTYPIDFVIDNDKVRGQAIEIKTHHVSSAESLLLAMVETFAVDSPLSDSDEQLLSLP